jgi:hypothetical protein
VFRQQRIDALELGVKQGFATDQGQMFGDLPDLINECRETLERQRIWPVPTVGDTHDATLVAGHVKMYLVMVWKMSDADFATVALRDQTGPVGETPRGEIPQHFSGAFHPRRVEDRGGSDDWRTRSLSKRRQPWRRRFTKALSQLRGAVQVRDGMREGVRIVWRNQPTVGSVLDYFRNTRNCRGDDREARSHRLNQAVGDNVAAAVRINDAGKHEQVGA